MPKQINLAVIPQPEPEKQEQVLKLLKSKEYTPIESEQARQLLLEHPDFRKQFGQLSEIALENILQSVTGLAILRESFKLDADDLRQSLSRPGDTALAKLIIEQCVNSYILHYHAEARYANVVEHADLSTHFWETRLSSTQRRFLRALETLDRVRRATAPVQINIAETQTNISTAAPLPSHTATTEELPPGETSDYIHSD